MSASRLAQAAIKIPKRIERGPTDILKALASTVKYVPDAPDAILQDDPYLLPMRPNDRVVYSLSKLSGKNTAKFLLNKHPEMFVRDDAEPKVEAFLPPEDLRLDMNLTEEDLTWCIDNNDVINASIAYQGLQEKEIKIADETLLKFFELVCYSNEDKMSDDIEFTRGYFARDADKQLVQQTWKLNGLASKIFNQIKEDLDPPRVYSAMIAGLSKYNEHDTAKQVFQDFKDAHPDKALFVDAYNGLLNSVRNLNSSVATAHEAVDEIVKEMEQHLVMPNLATFNVILNVYRSFNCDEATVEKSIKLVNDMMALGIKPSLATFDQLINILFRLNYGRVHGAKIDELLSYISSNDSIFEVRDSRDVLFLRNVMRSATNAPNLSWANKLHKIFMKRPNLFPSHSLKQQYLDMYFRLLVTTEKLETTLNFYDTYVPMTYKPSADSYDALAEALDLYQADQEIIDRIGRNIIDSRLGTKVKNDAIFRKNPEYVKQLEEMLDRRPKFD